MASPPRGGALTGLHVVVVDDNEDSREILLAVLSYHGAMVTVTEDARTALRTLRSVMPDVVVVDYYLGKTEAGQLLQQARSAGCEAPFILISSGDFDPHQAVKDGFAAFLRKPVDHNHLIEALLMAVARPNEHPSANE
jgi:DNA-binding NtrC family response regulator